MEENKTNPSFLLKVQSTAQQPQWAQVGSSCLTQKEREMRFREAWDLEREAALTTSWPVRVKRLWGAQEVEEERKDTEENVGTPEKKCSSQGSQAWTKNSTSGHTFCRTKNCCSEAWGDFIFFSGPNEPLWKFQATCFSNLMLDSSVPAGLEVYWSRLSKSTLFSNSNFANAKENMNILR